MEFNTENNNISKNCSNQNIQTNSINDINNQSFSNISSIKKKKITIIIYVLNATNFL